MARSARIRPHYGELPLETRFEKFGRVETVALKSPDMTGFLKSSLRRIDLVSPPRQLLLGKRRDWDERSKIRRRAI